MFSKHNNLFNHLVLFMVMNPIEKKEGPCIILAGAGTGKTYSIVEKVKYLIGNKIYNPEKIVCITFSNEAANNLLNRIQKVVDLEGKELAIQTFHAFSADLLRSHGHLIDINEDFKILTPEESKVVLHRNFKVTPYYCHKYISSIGTAKDLGISLKELEDYVNKKLEGIDVETWEKRLESLQFELQTIYLKKDSKKKKTINSEVKRINEVLNLSKFVNCWKGYEKLKKLKNYQDYSDLNMNALKLLKENPEIANNFDYVIVDEFQDTNKVQLDLLKFLAPHRNITVVGDMNQSIYRFRGAYKENLNEFREHFDIKSSDIYNLDRSYRSPNKILDIAHKLIVNNYLNPEECFKVENANNIVGENAQVYELNNAKEEARKIVELVKNEIEEGKEMEELCIMFRTHQQGRVIKRALDIAGIEYCSVNKNSLLKNHSVKTVIDYLNIVEKLRKKDKGGEQAWWDLIYQLDFLESDLIKIGRFIKETKDEEKKEECCLSVKLFNSLDKMPLSTSGRLASKILIDRLKLMLESSKKEVPELLKDIYNIVGFIKGDKGRVASERMLNLNKFLEIAKSHASLYSPDLTSFIHYLDVLYSLNIEIESSEIEKKGIRLMTLHSTKGLEYNTVIISNMAQKRFPMERITRNLLIPPELSPELKDKIRELHNWEVYPFLKDYELKNQILEERRLCYVAFTRAKQKLILTYAKEYGKKKHYPSQFLNEIDYKKNEFVDFILDNNEKYVEPEVEIKSASKFGKVLSSNNFDDLLINMIKSSEKEEKIKLDPSGRYFSPSALLLFDECQKKYEYKYIYNMPDEKIVSWEAIRLGSFVHLVLEYGVQNGFDGVKQFLDYANELNLQDDWESVDLNEAGHMIKVFYERNKNKFDARSRTEQKLRTEIDGIKFIGFADRIDFDENGDVEIIDYKTGRSYIEPKKRNWQLGYYAIAAEKLGLGKVKKITLDVLRQEKPLEFEVDDNGIAKSTNGRMQFDIREIKEELIDAAKNVIRAHYEGFKPCPVEKNCEFCNEYVYDN